MPGVGDRMQRIQSSPRALISALVASRSTRASGTPHRSGAYGSCHRARPVYSSLRIRLLARYASVIRIAHRICLAFYCGESSSNSLSPVVKEKIRPGSGEVSRFSKISLGACKLRNSNRRGTYCTLKGDLKPLFVAFKSDYSMVFVP